jgi:RES domain-containing protein
LNRVYRILRKPFSKTPLDGEGSYRFGGRWSNPGTRLVYTSEHLSLAMLEYFVHIDAADPPKDLVLVVAEIPSNVSRTSVSPTRLPEDWRRTPAPAEITTIGDRFARKGWAAVLIVPSALAPAERNLLINPRHPDFAKIRIHKPQNFDYDPRFFLR